MELDAIFGNITGIALVLTSTLFMRALLHSSPNSATYDELTLDQMQELTEGDLAPLQPHDVDNWLALRQLDRRMASIQTRAVEIRAEAGLQERQLRRSPDSRSVDRRPSPADTLLTSRGESGSPSTNSALPDLSAHRVAAGRR